jgi:hypothetical protein
MKQTEQDAECFDFATLRSAAERELKHTGFRLHFPRQLEAQFQADSSATRITDLRNITRNGVGLYVALNLLINGFLIGHPNWTVTLWQLGTVVLVTLAGLRFMRPGVSFERREGALFLTCLTCTLSAILAIGAQAPPIALRDLIFGIVPLNFALIFARLFFPYAVTLCLSSSIVFAIVVLTCARLSLNELTLLFGLLLLLSVPSLFGLHSLERAIRRSYLLEVIQRLNYEQEVAANAVLTDLSFTDPLTGIANRRRMDDVLGRLSQRPSSFGAPARTQLAKG